MLVAALNVQSGGFADYDPAGTEPPRLPAIRDLVTRVGADTVGLVDTFRWRELWSPEELCDRFGYRQALAIDMNSTRVDPRIGITVLTNEASAHFEVLRLGDRDCVKTVIDRPDGRRHVYTVYLDDLHAAARLREIEALRADILATPHIPCAVMGDCNDLPPEALGPGWRVIGGLTRARIVRRAARLTRSKTLVYGVTALGEISKGTAVKRLRSLGLVDAGQRRRRPPTASPKLGPFTLNLPVDYIFTRGLAVSDFRVRPERVSDHKLISAELH